MTDTHHILLIEDSPTQALNLSALLENEGFAVHRATTAEEGLEYLRSQQPDMAIVDYHLPGMGGDEFCRLIRLSAATETIPLLILTESAETEVERHGLESGADDYVTKFADTDILLARVHALLRKPRAALSLTESFSVGFQAQRVLIVDDSPTYLAFLEDQLIQEGYGVDLAESGYAALAAINKKPVDCIVVDLIMPGIDGIELCKRLHDYRRSSHLSLPVLMVTGQDSKEDMMRALEAGADDFVSKSSDIVILKARIRALLRRKMLRDEHDRILGEFRKKELEIIRERSAKEAAEARAQLVEELEKANRDLEAAYRELKETQLQLVHSAKMASLGELVAGIAHEVNNPIAYSMSHLGTVKAILEDAAEQAGDRLADKGAGKLAKARQRTEEAYAGLERVRDLVAKLRTFSRLDEGEFKRSDVARDIESALALVGYRIGEGVRVTTRFDKDNALYCAPGALNQVLMNLLLNAIDAVGDQGEITIATSRRRDHFEISVADTGPGVPAELRGRIFDPFFTTKDVGSGTGLGLAISYRIVERHRGSITVRDRKGGGVEFVVRIPTNLARRQGTE